MEAMRTRPTEANLKPDFTILPHSKRISPASTDLSNFASAMAFLCRCASVINQLELSTFARVRKPRTIGSVVVGSTWDKLVNIRKDSESKGVADRERWLRTTEPPKKSGSCVVIGMRNVPNGLQLCCLNSCLRRVANNFRVRFANIPLNFKFTN